MPNTRESIEKVARLLMPYAAKRQAAFEQTTARLVHYTTAESALSILKSQQLWMRNARVMSDFSEIQYGFERLRDYFHANENKNRTRMYEALNRCHVNIGVEAIETFDNWWSEIHAHTYVCCLSEHYEREDRLGRLSMWRAFGRGVPGVAIVLKNVTQIKAQATNIVISPVAYLMPEQVGEQMDEVIANIENNCELLKAEKPEVVRHLMYRALLFAVVSMKHPGFEEEKEWRAIYTPKIYPSKYVLQATESIRGIPQIVHKIPLKNVPEAQIDGVQANQLIDRLIVGPADHSFAIYQALSSELQSLGVENAHEKVFISGIPLRD